MAHVQYANQWSWIWVCIRNVIFNFDFYKILKIKSNHINNTAPHCIYVVWFTYFLIYVVRSRFEYLTKPHIGLIYGFRKKLHRPHRKHLILCTIKMVRSDIIQSPLTFNLFQKLSILHVYSNLTIHRRQIPQQLIQ